ncbi:MAG TPA: hypothetical protein VM101_14135 [Flavitalea sp.]|nr:hypothetical protein [Flavitalea sp.]
MNYVRVAGHGLNKNNIEATIKDAQDTHLFGIEVDNDIPGRYNSFLDPTDKLLDIKTLADRAHAINNHAFVYIAGLECITSNAPGSQHTFFKDHPDWVQRDINNRPAIFGSGDAFWIDKGDEDVWISPYAKEWRNRYMQIVRQIASTGIDGIYVDIPYWMTHFTGWEDTWASFDDNTLEAFRSKTGLDAKKDLKIGDFSDANFRRWVDFRIQTLTNFMAEIDSNAKSINADCKTIAEIYPGTGEEAVRVGADVYELYNVVDAIAHEFSGGEGNAASKTPQHWFDRMIGMYAFRAFAGEKSSWMLSYSWDKENKVRPIEPMKNLALSNLVAGTNNYDAAGHVMSGSNDYKTRTLINEWVAVNEKTFYDTRTPIRPVGVYFSPQTRNYFSHAFIESFEGIMRMMLQSHLEFQIVTPKTLNEFKGSVLILPDVKCISSDEISQIEKLANDKTGLIVTGESGRYDETGAEIKTNQLLQFLNIGDTHKKSSGTKHKFIYYPDCPGKAYSQLTKSEFNSAAAKASWQTTKFFSFLKYHKKELSSYFKLNQQVSVEASPFISTQITLVDGNPHIFLANYAGLKSDTVVNQIPQKNVKIIFSASAAGKIYYLPFLGKKQQLTTQFKNNQLSCVIPPIEKGGVVWLENTARVK